MVMFDLKSEPEEFPDQFFGFLFRGIRRPTNSTGQAWPDDLNLSQNQPKPSGPAGEPKPLMNPAQF